MHTPRQLAPPRQSVPSRVRRAPQPPPVSYGRPRRSHDGGWVSGRWNRLNTGKKVGLVAGGLVLALMLDAAGVAGASDAPVVGPAFKAQARVIGRIPTPPTETCITSSALYDVPQTETAPARIVSGLFNLCEKKGDIQLVQSAQGTTPPKLIGLLSTTPSPEIDAARQAYNESNRSSWDPSTPLQIIVNTTPQACPSDFTKLTKAVKADAPKLASNGVTAAEIETGTFTWESNEPTIIKAGTKIPGTNTTVPYNTISGAEVIPVSCVYAKSTLTEQSKP